jgi:hypothetical protein
VSEKNAQVLAIANAATTTIPLALKIIFFIVISLFVT